jgi:Ni/Fe-hydrogenase subunit HybB-like protein
MSYERIDRDRLLEPIRTTTWKYYAGVGVSMIVGLIGVYAWYVMLTEGLQVTGLRGWGTGGGVSWGLFTGFMVWWVGVAHGGIAVSAGARLLKKDAYKPIARIAELLTLFALGKVGLLITWHLGRPDLIFKTVTQWPAAVSHSPLTWDVMIILLYFVMSMTYLILTLRDDIYALREHLPDRIDPLYSAFLLGYDPEESEKVSQMAWWLALGILLLVPLLSGGVVPWIFQLIGSQPGWFSAVTGPVFVTGAITSALGMILVISYLFRWAYGWEDIITDDIFAGLATVDAVFILGYLWFMLQERLTGSYAAPVYESELNREILTGEMAPFFWLTIGLLVVAFAYFTYQTLTGRVSAATTGAVGVLPALAILVEKTRFVVAGLLYPTLLYSPGTYSPTWIEWSLVVSTFALTALGYFIWVKLIPMIEVPEGEEMPDSSDTDEGTEVKA